MNKSATSSIGQLSVHHNPHIHGYKRHLTCADVRGLGAYTPRCSTGGGPKYEQRTTHSGDTLVAETSQLSLQRCHLDRPTSQQSGFFACCKAFRPLDRGMSSKATALEAQIVRTTCNCALPLPSLFVFFATAPVGPLRALLDGQQHSLNKTDDFRSTLEMERRNHHRNESS